MANPRLSGGFDIQVLLGHAMDDLDMNSFLNSTDQYPIDNQSCTLSPTDEHIDEQFGSQPPFDSNTSFGSDTSFNSSGSFFDQCFTPITSRRGSSNTIDIDGFSSRLTPPSSSGLNSPIDGEAFHIRNAISLDKKIEGHSDKDVKAQAHGSGQLYTTPSGKSVRDHQMISFDYHKVRSAADPLELHQNVDGRPEIMREQLKPSPVDFVIPSQTVNRHTYHPTTPVQTPRVYLSSPFGETVQDQHLAGCGYSKVSNTYVTPDIHHTVDRMPGVMYENLPALLYNNYASPEQPISSPVDYVVPSQTVNRYPYRPSTPGGTPQTQLASPLASYGQPSKDIKYFMSPRSDTRSLLVNLDMESPSRSIPRRKSSERALESSRALHHFQALNGNLISKQSKRQQKATAKIERVAAGLFRCDYKGCNRKGFKRHEHLKRHRRTHQGLPGLPCPFCPKRLADDRADNWRSHVKLHAVRAPRSRTRYVEEAEELVKKMNEEKLLRKRRTHDEVNSAHTRRARTSQKSSK